MSICPEGYSPSIVQGYAVSFFSFGRVMSSPFLGRLSDKSYVSSLTVSQSLLVLGCCLYVRASERSEAKRSEAKRSERAK